MSILRSVQMRKQQQRLLRASGGSASRDVEAQPAGRRTRQKPSEVCRVVDLLICCCLFSATSSRFLEDSFSFQELLNQTHCYQQLSMQVLKVAIVSYCLMFFGMFDAIRLLDGLWWSCRFHRQDPTHCMPAPEDDSAAAAAAVPADATEAVPLMHWEDTLQSCCAIHWFRCFQRPEFCSIRICIFHYFLSYLACSIWWYLMFLRMFGATFICTWSKAVPSEPAPTMDEKWGDPPDQTVQRKSISR